MLQGPFEIPEIPDEVLLKLARRVQPLVEREGKLHHMPTGQSLRDLRKTSYPWVADPEPELRDVEGLQEIVKITTLHRYSHYGFFKPSVAEVLAQLPEQYADSELYFFVKGPLSAKDLNEEAHALNAGFHVAETTLYKAPEGTTWYKQLGWLP